MNFKWSKENQCLHEILKEYFGGTSTMFDLFFNEDTVANGLQDDAANIFAQLLNKLVYEEHLSMDEAVKRILNNHSYRTDKP